MLKLSWPWIIHELLPAVPCGATIAQDEPDGICSTAGVALVELLGML